MHAAQWTIHGINNQHSVNTGHRTCRWEQEHVAIAVTHAACTRVRTRAVCASAAAPSIWHPSQMLHILLRAHISKVRRPSE